MPELQGLIHSHLRPPTSSTWSLAKASTEPWWADGHSTPVATKPRQFHVTTPWWPADRKPQRLDSLIRVVVSAPHPASSPSLILTSVSLTSHDAVSSGCATVAWPRRHLRGSCHRHSHSDLSIFSRHLACDDMVPCVYGLIGVQFNPICIQFIELLYCIPFVLLDSYMGVQVRD